jgi:hypothetical protein
MGQDCLDRRTLSALAAGRCPTKDLRAVQRHLPTCARCRAAVVASAAGVRGPGDTVVLKRSDAVGAAGGRTRTVLKVGSVVVSLLVVGGAWRFGQSSPLPEASPPAAAPAASSPAASSPAASSPAASSSAASEASPAAHPLEPLPSETVELAAPLRPTPGVPQVEVRPLDESATVATPPVEPPVTLDPYVTDPAPASVAAALPAAAAELRSRREAHSEPRPKRLPSKKPAPTSSRPKRSDLPETNEGEGTDRFGLEW